MWTAEQTREIQAARRAFPNATVKQFRRLAAAISDLIEVGSQESASTYDMLKPETRATLKL